MDKYYYLNARVRSMKGDLLDRADYEKLLRMTTSEIAEWLEESKYKQEIDQLGLKHQGKKLVELALRKHLIKQAKKLTDMANDEVERILRAYLLRWDARNLRKILRWKLADAETRMSREELKEFLAPSPHLTLDELEQLITIEMNREELNDHIKTKLPMLAPGLCQEEEAINVECRLDRNYYQHLINTIEEFGQLTPVINNFFKRLIAITNIKVILRLKVNQTPETDIENYLVLPDDKRLLGSFGSKQLLTLIEEDVETIVETLKKYDLGKHIPDDYQSLEKVEDALDAFKADSYRDLFWEGPLTIGPIFGYIMAQEIEVDYLRKIIRAKELGLAQEEIEQRLVLA